MTPKYDAIVVGARCAGSATARLLALRGYRVLLVDKASFPSDTLSTHLVHPTGVAALDGWGMLDQVKETGAPPIGNYSVDFGMFRIAGSPRPAAGGFTTAYAPRRSALDYILVRAAEDSGAEVRPDCVVEELLFDNDAVTGVKLRSSSGMPFTESARVVIGADGRNSLVARQARAQPYLERPTYAATYYAYWSGVRTDGLEVYVRPSRSFGAFPTADGLTVLVMSWPRAEFDANRGDVEGNYLKSLQLAPALAERVAAGTRATRFYGTGNMPGFYRTAHGPGWALVGDARHHKDACTAKGISEAFADADALTAALDAAWSGRADPDVSLTTYQHQRDEQTLPMYDFTCQLASFEPPPPPMAHLLAAVSTDERASADFVSILAGTVSLPEFMTAANVDQILRHASPITTGAASS